MCVCVCVCVRLSTDTPEVSIPFTHQQSEVFAKYRGIFSVTSECVPLFLRVFSLAIAWFEYLTYLGMTSVCWQVCELLTPIHILPLFNFNTRFVSTAFWLANFLIGWIAELGSHSKKFLDSSGFYGFGSRS